LYCSECGEKRIDKHDFSLIHFFTESVEHLTHIEFKAVGGLRKLITEPGALTRDYLDGKRKGRVGPVQLFVVLNIALALLAGFTGWKPLDTPLEVQTSKGALHEFKLHEVEKAMENSGKNSAEFEDEFDTESKMISKEFLFSMVPAFALGLSVVYGFRHYFYEHLVFATHFYSFLLLVMLTFALLIQFGVSSLAAATGLSLTGKLALAVENVIFASYLAFALRRVHGGGFLAASLRAIVLTAGFWGILSVYKVALFPVTLWMTH
jgi:hypothetical protein